MRASPAVAKLSCLPTARLHRDPKASLASELSMTDIYRFPAVAGLAAHPTNRGSGDAQLGHAADRTASPRNALAARSGRGVS
jgi:hypothetical protein